MLNWLCQSDIECNWTWDWRIHTTLHYSAFYAILGYYLLPTKLSVKYFRQKKYCSPTYLQTEKFHVIQLSLYLYACVCTLVLVEHIESEGILQSVTHFHQTKMYQFFPLLLCRQRLACIWYISDMEYGVWECFARGEWDFCGVSLYLNADSYWLLILMCISKLQIVNLMVLLLWNWMRIKLGLVKKINRYAKAFRVCFVI